MTNYQKRKAEAKQKAVDWQLDFVNHNYSWSKVAAHKDYFERLGRRYGLLGEFRENGIC